MNGTEKLPYPTEEELNDDKSKYFERLIDMNLTKKYGIDETTLYKWIHHNYQAIFLFNEEITFKQLKKYI